MKLGSLSCRIVSLAPNLRNTHSSYHSATVCADLDELAPDYIHVIMDGRIVASGGMEIAELLERDGYESFRPAALVSP